MSLYLGVDVGLTGGIAILDSDQGLKCLFRFDKQDPLQIFQAALWGVGAEELLVAVEAVGPRNGQDMSSMFNFGISYGKVLGFCAAHELDTCLYSPQAWQKYLPQAGTPKERVRLFIEQKYGFDGFIFEGCRVPHQGCMDAVAIATYHMMIKEGRLAAPKPTKKAKRRKAMQF
jgi:crossover junction endodeoxyribonuclease RuvC